MLTEEQIKILHDHYQLLTGFQVPLTFTRRDAWSLWAREVAEWIRHVETPGLSIRGALEGLVKHRRKNYGDKPATLAATLKFSHLVERPDKAVDDLAVWHAGRRARRLAEAENPARAAARRSAGLAREAGSAERAARSAGEVMADSPAVQAMIVALRNATKT